MLYDKTRFQKYFNWICHFVKYKPANLYLAIFDGAKSHLDFEIIETVEQMTFYCLPSNITYELQPLNKSVFRSFEYHWDEEFQLYWLNKGERTLIKQRLEKIFAKVG